MFPAFGIVCLLLFGVGCSTTQTVYRPNQNSGKDIDVISWGKTYHFVGWSINEAGDITGDAYLKEAGDSAITRPTTISKRDITSVHISEFSPEKTSKLIGGLAIVGVACVVVYAIVEVSKMKFHFFDLNIP
jgi:hypothetical protein